MSPAQSSESVCSAPSGNHDGSISNRPKLLNEKNTHLNRSIDSNHNTFILFEEENEDPVEKHTSHGVQEGNLKNIDYQKETVCSQNSVSSSLDENENPSTALADAKSSKQSTYSSGSDIRRFSVSMSDIEPVTVPYLSPLVLRKEVENVLEHEGDNCMTKPEFVDQHPIIYWNLIWFFKRIGVSSHLPSLVLSADSITKGKQIPPPWQKADGRNVSIHCIWDNVKLHEDMGQPFYSLWVQQENGEQSPLVTALLTDERQASK
ncbi:C-myc promoter-binding protein, partial [Stegodyphus mimosarum]